ncbi:MAG: Rne/Rng family ribonuclease [Candidatus Marinimicrobia bacterium]|nr:Rne/Rng family ribonuclease [Candidatus Neomarinimicrobiota bacterium]
MNKEIYINETATETRIAITEDGNLVELYIETPEEKSSVGNIYNGVVQNVIPGMRAAFINIGQKVNAFLPFSEIGHNEQLPTILDADEKEEGEIPIPVQSPEKLKIGDPILVQVTKDSWGEKGPRVTTNISIPGRFLVLVPYANYIGISKKIQSYARRKELKTIARSIKPEGFGLIVRTVAEDKTDEDLKRDMDYLIDKWQELQKNLKQSSPPSLVYRDMEITSSVIRDLFTNEVSRVLVDSKKMFRKIQNYAHQVAPNLEDRIFFHKNGSIFEIHNISKQIERSLSRRIWLRGGGYIIIEHTEALVSIDVNSGKFIGKKSQESNNLRINMEAATEIARQLRLRDIGGLIIIDFIDMEDRENRKKLVEYFRKELQKDRAKVSISDVSEFGLVEMTRQRVRTSLFFSTSEECPMCHGTGRIPSKESVISKIDNWIRRYRLHTKDKFIRITVHPAILSHLSSGATKKQFRHLQVKNLLWIDFKSDDTLKFDEFRVFSRRLNKDITDLY